MLRKALHLLAVSYFHDRNKNAVAGANLLQLVFLGGEVDAGIDAAMAELLLASYEVRKPYGLRKSQLLSPQTAKFIREQALSHKEWRAMIVYLSQATKENGTEMVAREHCILARELFDMTEPHKSAYWENLNVLQRYEDPCKILYTAASNYLTRLPQGSERDAIQTTLETALRDGLCKYSSASAIPPALRQSNVIPRHSSRWLELANQSAASGDKEAAFDLAIYHLGKAGWRGKNKVSPKTKPKDWTGINWLAVSAARSSPNPHAMINKYLGLAHLLREHGYLDEGYYWLAYAKENVSEAGLDLDQFWTKMVTGFERDWKEMGTLEISKDFFHPSDRYFAPYLDERDK